MFILNDEYIIEKLDNNDIILYNKTTKSTVMLNSTASILLSSSENSEIDVALENYRKHITEKGVFGASLESIMEDARLTIQQFIEAQILIENIEVTDVTE